jgi:hypothetical protein
LTIRPSRFNRTGVPIILYALSGVSVFVAYHLVIYPPPSDTWLDTAGAVVAIAIVVVCCVVVALVVPRAYIRVDDSTITFGPSLTTSAARSNSFDRREVARLRAVPMSRTILFLRSDGSTLISASGHFWDRDGLRRLAGFLGIPIEG